MSEYRCTKAEREFLDAIEKFVKSPDQWDCPFCSYDGLYPQTPELESAFKALAIELEVSRNE